MVTCGYICPSCGGAGFTEKGDCNWCKPLDKGINMDEKSIDEWTKLVHEGPCCGDLGQGETEV